MHARMCARVSAQAKVNRHWPRTSRCFARLQIGWLFRVLWKMAPLLRITTQPPHDTVRQAGTSGMPPLRRTTIQETPRRHHLAYPKKTTVHLSRQTGISTNHIWVAQERAICSGPGRMHVFQRAQLRTLMHPFTRSNVLGSSWPRRARSSSVREPQQQFNC